jgi:hypothetical protein
LPFVAKGVDGARAGVLFFRRRHPNLSTFALLTSGVRHVANALNAFEALLRFSRVAAIFCGIGDFVPLACKGYAIVQQMLVHRLFDGGSIDGMVAASNASSWQQQVRPSSFQATVIPPATEWRSRRFVTCGSALIIRQLIQEKVVLDPYLVTHRVAQCAGQVTGDREFGRVCPTDTGDTSRAR